ncbi:histidine kinase dimerization/phospho-acceptor domain-containing protein [Actinokineospora guangxiensis]|uniref:Signal transduction histidine-protein kinase/phosphatase MprB n=1 Tax=Actinokineospora guangxiensis TaxID=1490288 RepID=A0ABW0EIA0_9PSEU
MRAPRPIAVRITGLCLLVAGVVALVGGLVSAKLVADTAREVTRQTLADQADVLAAQWDDSALGLRRAVEILRRQGVEPVLLRRNGNVVGGGPLAKRAALEAGLTDPARGPRATIELDGRTLLVEVRRSGGAALALVGDAGTAKGIGRTLVGNIALALGIGLLLAGVAGLALARLVARPLIRTADVARAMGRGRRDLRAPEEGPREVVRVAASVNELAGALAETEERERRFLLSVSHELRTPLTAVRGFAESLADGVVTAPEDVVRAARTIESEAARLNRLVTDLLDLARLGTAEFRIDATPVDLATTFADAAQVWSARCAEVGVPFHYDAPGAPVHLVTDARRVRQVLDGLLENALRATPPGKPIVVSLRDGVTFSVRDGGPGLADEDYAVAFEPHVLRSRYAGLRPGGTGIGLALAGGLVAGLGGSITAGAAPEGGAMFQVHLPGPR